MIICSDAEAKYKVAYDEYMDARSGFYAGTVSAEKFIELRKAMEAALAAWLG